MNPVNSGTSGIPAIPLMGHRRSILYGGCFHHERRLTRRKDKGSRSPDERTGYADSLFLPLALLRRITFRPPGVLIRFRNPWVLLRFSLLVEKFSSWLSSFVHAHHRGIGGPNRSERPKNPMSPGGL